MRYNQFYRFKYFDPLEGNLPDPYAELFIQVNYRARKILDDFSLEELVISTLGINELVRDKAFIDPFSQDIKNHPIKIQLYGQDLEIIPTTNDIEALFKNIGNLSIEEHIEVCGFEWPHVFAALALYQSELISDGLYKLKFRQLNKYFPEPSNDHLLQKANEFLVEAQQAVTIAEMLINQKDVFKKLQSEANRKAVNLRFQNSSNILKNVVLALYLDKHKNKSNRQAAELILNELRLDGKLKEDSRFNEVIFEGKVVLNTDDPRHRFEKWIGEYKKQLIQ